MMLIGLTDIEGSIKNILSSIDNIKESFIENAEDVLKAVFIDLPQDMLIGIYNMFGGNYGVHYEDGKYPNPYAFLKIVPKEDGSGQITYVLEPGAVAFARDGWHDDIVGSSSADSLVGKSGTNSIWGQGGDDHIEGRGNDDQLFGGDGNDKIEAGNGDDVVIGGAGDDFLLGEAGDDTILGGDGDDIILGGKGDDQIQCDDSEEGSVAGADYVEGGAGNDTVLGGGGDDILLGGEGNDYLDGGTGGGTFTGGAGDDYYHISLSNDGTKNGHVVINDDDGKIVIQRYLRHYLKGTAYLVDKDDVSQSYTLKGYHAEEVGGGLVITTGPDSSITIQEPIIYTVFMMGSIQDS